MTTPASLPSDPLSALGSSLFLTVLSFLPYPALTILPSVSRSWRYHSRCNRTGIWLAACRRTGVDPGLIIKLIALESKADRSAASVDEDELQEYADWNPTDRAFASDPDPTAGRDAGEVDWKRVCEVHVLEDKNWRFGRCRERWIYPDDEMMAAWRFKVDDVDQTCIITTITGGLHVVDLKTSDGLFGMPNVRGHAHLEFCKGFVVFDVDGGLNLQVYRTRQAVSNSAHPWPTARKLPREAESYIFVDDADNDDEHWDPHDHILPQFGAPTEDEPPVLARGTMSYYRQISPPTPCHAFRARADGEGTEGERAVLGTAGEKAVYIWDLDEESQAPEVIPVPEFVGGIGVKYLEFDDDHVFLCGKTQLYIFSRRTKQVLLAFPPVPTIPVELCAAAYAVEYRDRAEVQPLSPPEGVDEGEEAEGSRRSAIVGRANLAGWRSDQLECLEPLGEEQTGTDPEEVDMESRIWVHRDYDFTACHYNSSDLVYTSMLGHLFITRNYAAALAIPNPAERAEAWAQQTLIINTQDAIFNLAVDGSHITGNTPFNIFFLDTSSLPTLPLPSALERPRGTPPVRLHAILSANPGGVGPASCAQIHRSTIYYNYMSKMDSVRGQPASPFNPRQPYWVPKRAQTGFGVCIRGWDFSKY